jgi:hypothetical protein
MGFLKKAQKGMSKINTMGGLVPGGDVPSNMLFGALGQHLADERKQHEPHEKVKEIHHHYHKKKK